MPYTGFHWESAWHAWERRHAKPPLPFALAASPARGMLLESAPALEAGMPAQPLAARCHSGQVLLRTTEGFSPNFLQNPEMRSLFSMIHKSCKTAVKMPQGPGN